jgi:hypothetical protein
MFTQLLEEAKHNRNKLGELEKKLEEDIALTQKERQQYLTVLFDEVFNDYSNFQVYSVLDQSVEHFSVNNPQNSTKDSISTVSHGDFIRGYHENDKTQSLVFGLDTIYLIVRDKEESTASLYLLDQTKKLKKSELVPGQYLEHFSYVPSYGEKFNIEFEDLANNKTIRNTDHTLKFRAFYNSLKKVTQMAINKYKNLQEYNIDTSEEYTDERSILEKNINVLKKINS